MNGNGTLNHTNQDYAPFLKRFAAFLIDNLILSMAITGVASLGFIDIASGSQAQGAASYVSGPYMAAVVIISGLYYILLHSSKWQATIGKRFVGIKVATDSGEQVTVGRAAIRFIVMEVVSSILYIGYFFMFFTQKRQTLHDLAAKTVVINDK